ncbi:50S ribosomal protein L4 [Chloroflexota bacterium]
MQVTVYNTKGEEVRHIDISDKVFAVPFHRAVVHQALVRQQANARQGTASTKTRGEVSGSKVKLHRQKHTGLARAGSRKSPLRRGGGVVFGPKPRSYRQAMPKKMRRLAIRCLLSAKAKDKELVVLDDLNLAEPRTKDMVQMLTAIGAGDSALITSSEPNVVKSARNLMGIKAMPANLLNVVDLLSHKMLVMPVAGVNTVERLWGEGQEGNSASS